MIENVPEIIIIKAILEIIEYSGQILKKKTCPRVYLIEILCVLTFYHFGIRMNFPGLYILPYTVLKIKATINCLVSKQYYTSFLYTVMVSVLR